MIRNSLFSICFFLGIIIISIVFLPAFFLPRKVTLLGGKLMGYWTSLCLKIFLSMRKKDPLMGTESVKSAMFKYDFEKIGEAKYRIDPRSFPALTKPIKFNFYHNKDQQQHISNQMKLYSNHAIPMGKLLQNTNLNIIFRSFNKSSDLLI